VNGLSQWNVFVDGSHESGIEAIASSSGVYDLLDWLSRCTSYLTALIVPGTIRTIFYNRYKVGCFGQ
jgi:hypothetical protein